MNEKSNHNWKHELRCIIINRVVSKVLTEKITFNKMTEHVLDVVRMYDE